MPQDTATITFTSSSSVGDTACTTYTILNDDIREGDESFSLSVAAVNSFDKIDGDTAAILITIQDDNDGKYPPIEIVVSMKSVHHTSTEACKTHFKSGYTLQLLLNTAFM